MNCQKSSETSVFEAIFLSHPIHSFARHRATLGQAQKPAPFDHAGVAELVDAPDLGSGAARRGGSSPFTRTKVEKKDSTCRSPRP